MSTRRFCISFFKLCLCLAATGIVIAQYIPDHEARIIEELDHIFVDIGGRNDAQFASAITPCSKYRDVFRSVDNNTFGRQTSAQWIRAAFRKVPAFLCLFCTHFRIHSIWRAPFHKWSNSRYQFLCMSLPFTSQCLNILY